MSGGELLGGGLTGAAPAGAGRTTIQTPEGARGGMMIVGASPFAEVISEEITVTTTPDKAMSEAISETITVENEA